MGQNLMPEFNGPELNDFLNIGGVSNQSLHQLVLN
jgi:hypothetical protein